MDEDLSLDGDGDGLTHLQEYQAKTAPDDADTDNDLIPDGWELDNGLDPLDTSDATSDTDGDGFSALEEYVSGDDPNEFDSAPVGIEFDFEGENLPESLSWIHEGSQPWELDQSDPLQGAQSLKSSGTLGSYQSSVIKTHVMSTGGIVRFALELGRSSGDQLKFYLDGELVQEWRGTSSGMPQTTVVFDLPAGAHELKWYYYGRYSWEDGAAWIDRLFISMEADSDADDVIDSWELRYFGHLDEDLSLDTDGDGFSALQEYESGTDPNQYGSAPTSIGLNRSIDIKDNKATIIDQPLVSVTPISATPTISKDSAVSYKVADKSDRHTMDNLLYAGVSGVQQQNYLQYSPYLDIDTAGVMSFSQLERYHQNLNHLHRQLINYQPTN